MDVPPPSLKHNILVAPLDWGLGHATRCVPILKSLIKQNCHVIVAGPDHIYRFFKAEFGEISFLHLPGYNVHYSRTKWSLPFTMARQIPKILSAIKKEQSWLQQAAIKYNLHGVISDNRYGLHHDILPSVLITHQLSIQTGLGKKADALLQTLNYHYINRFTECWVPDTKTIPNLAGVLSHPARLPEVPTHYIGPLSRFDVSAEKGRSLLVLLSGPEPQRTILENILLNQLSSFKQTVILLRGLPGATSLPAVPSHIKVYNHLPSSELQGLIAEADLVISRSGYSTVMDLALMQKKSILIPTPGQTEQEYLAEHLMKQQKALCIPQSRFNLRAALDLASSFPFQLQDFYSEHLHTTISSFLKTASRHSNNV